MRVVRVLITERSLRVWRFPEGRVFYFFLFVEGGPILTTRTRIPADHGKGGSDLKDLILGVKKRDALIVAGIGSDQKTAKMTRKRIHTRSSYEETTKTKKHQKYGRF